MGGHHHHHHQHDSMDLMADGSERYREIRKVTLIGSVIDLLLAVVKMVVGYAAQSQALIADGVHSLSDLATDAMVLLAAKHGSQDADETHPYGHGRFETVATVGLGVALIAVAVGIAWDATERLFHPNELLQPGIWALVVAAVSVLSKEWIYHYTMRVADKYNSNLLRANAWHSRSDAISSIIVVVGVGGSMLGLEYLDAVGAVGVSIMVARIGWELAGSSLHELVDTALDAERVEAIRKVILDVDGVEELHMLRTRLMGGEALVDVHILVNPKFSVSEGHYISELVRWRLIKEVSEVKDVLVHIDPEDDELVIPTKGMPTRSEIMVQLVDYWTEIEEAEQIRRVTLHYLNGKLIVEILLPLGVLSTTGDNRAELIGRFRAPEMTMDIIERIEVHFCQ